MNKETIKLIHVPDLFAGCTDKPSAYILVRIEPIEVDNVIVMNTITDTFYLMEDDAKHWLGVFDEAVTMTRDTYFAWFRANS